MITLAKPVLSFDLVEAVSLLCSPVFGALNMANAIAGDRTDAWILVHEFSLAQLVDETVIRDIDLSRIKAACCEVLVHDTPPFHEAVGYDPRPRCSLCCRRHFRPRDGYVLSCGDNDGFRNPPVWRWTRMTAREAMR